MDIYVQKDGQKLGPFPETKIRQGLDAGEFAPDDLAWRNGKASWQPLSALIALDVTQAPPFPANGEAVADLAGRPNGSEGASRKTYPTTETSSSPHLAEEQVVYDDGTSFQPARFTINGQSVQSPHVLVTTKRIRINSDNYLLSGLTSAKVECFTESMDRNRSYRRHKLLLRLSWGFFMVDVFVAMNYSYFYLLLLFGVLVVVGYAWRAKDLSEAKMVSTGYLLLEYQGKISKILIGACHVIPNISILKSLGRTDEEIAGYQQDCMLNHDRPQKIAEAIGTAIGGSNPFAV